MNREEIEEQLTHVEREILRIKRDLAVKRQERIDALPASPVLLYEEIQQLKRDLVERQERRRLLSQQLHEIVALQEPSALYEEADEKDALPAPADNRFQTLLEMVRNRDVAIHPYLRGEARSLSAVGPDMEFLHNYPIVPDYDCSSARKDNSNPLDLTTDEAKYLARLNDISIYSDDNSKMLTRPALCHSLALARLVRKDGQLLDPSVREPFKRVNTSVPEPVGRFIENPITRKLPRVLITRLGGRSSFSEYPNIRHLGKRKSTKRKTRKSMKRKTIHKRV
jgi:hypothetical protein